MTHRTRLFRTLSCLVLAMCGTSSLLGWSDRNSRLVEPDVEREGATLAAVDRLVHSAVAEASDLRALHWKSVDVISGPGFAANTRLLAAMPGRPACHFRVDALGRPIATDAWRDQVALPMDETAVIIQIERRGEAPALTPAQAQCVRALVDELQALRRVRLADLLQPSPAFNELVARFQAGTDLPVRYRDEGGNAASIGAPSGVQLAVHHDRRP